jgi:hypothetical protein
MVAFGVEARATRLLELMMQGMLTTRHPLPKSIDTREVVKLSYTCL